MSFRFESALRQLISWFLLFGFFWSLTVSTAINAAPLSATSRESSNISLRIPESLQLRGGAKSLTSTTSSSPSSSSFRSAFCITGSRGLQFSVSSYVSRGANKRALETAVTGGLNPSYAGSQLVYRAARDCPQEAGAEIVMQLTQSQFAAATTQGFITVTVAAE